MTANGAHSRHSGIVPKRRSALVVQRSLNVPTRRSVRSRVSRTMSICVVVLRASTGYIGDAREASLVTEMRPRACADCALLSTLLGPRRDGWHART